MNVKLLTIFATVLSMLSMSGLAQQDELRTICFNVRYENDSDGQFAWTNRRNAVIKMLHHENPDVIGLQEVLKSQVDFLNTNLENYAFIGVGREDGMSKGEYSPIYYHTKSLKLIKNGHFWLSETPDRPSKGWDAACERVATWAVFEQLGSKKRFICINTHFDHVGTLSRKESSLQMLDSVNSVAGGLPAIIMGDFNATIDDPSLAPLRRAAVDARSTKPEFEHQYKYTYIGFSPKTHKSLIDHIFVQKFKVKKYTVITESYGAEQLSDHHPVMCTLIF